jgi:hypothetical protein
VSGSGAAYNPADPAQWKGCVGERSYPDDVRDTPPSAGHMWTRYWWPSDKNDQMPSGKKPDNAWLPINMIFNDSSTCNNSTGRTSHARRRSRRSPAARRRCTARSTACGLGAAAAR